MRALEIYRNGIFAGTLIEENRLHYVFKYDDAFFYATDKPAISLTISKKQKEHHSQFLFPYFFNMLSELQSIQLRIDEEDNFGLLAATAQYDTIGAITVKPLL
jgi:HipA-like protein